MTSIGSSPAMVTEGDWTGWRYWAGEPFEELAGPFYSQVDAHGPVCAMTIEQRHLNGSEAVHGGLLATFADSAIFSLSEEYWIKDGGVTISLALHYMDAVRQGERVEARAHSLRDTREFVFVNGVARVGPRPVLAFNGIIKKVRASG